MNQKWKEIKKEKHQFRSYYCAGCRQRKPCGLLTDWDSKWQDYCCLCYFQSEQARAEEYSDYQQVYQRKLQERANRIQQLKLLRDYLGCKECGSKEVDAYFLYENSQLVCQSCRMKKEGRSSGPISWEEKQKWCKRR